MQQPERRTSVRLVVVRGPYAEALGRSNWCGEHHYGVSKTDGSQGRSAIGHGVWRRTGGELRLRAEETLARWNWKTNAATGERIAHIHGGGCEASFLAENEQGYCGRMATVAGCVEEIAGKKQAGKNRGGHLESNRGCDAICETAC